MKYPWFRFYVEAVHDRKLRRLRPEHRWLFVACLCVAADSSSSGRLLVAGLPMSAADLADIAGMSPRSVRAGLDAMLKLGLVVSDDNGGLSVPKWDERQFESDLSTARVRRHRERRRNVSVTPPETETETETEREGAWPVDNPGSGTVRALIEAHFRTRNKRIAGPELDALAVDLEREGVTAETVGDALRACAYPSDVRNRLKSLTPIRGPTGDEPYGWRPPFLDRCPTCHCYQFDCTCDAGP